MNRWCTRLIKLKDHALGQPTLVQNVQIVQKSSSPASFEHFEQFEQWSPPLLEPWGPT
jgi:hypothetical protein